MKRTAKPPTPPMVDEVPSSPHDRYGAHDETDGKPPSGLGRGFPSRPEPSQPRPLAPMATERPTGPMQLDGLHRPTGPMQPVELHRPIGAVPSGNWPNAPEPPPPESAHRAPLPTIPVLAGPEHPSAASLAPDGDPSSSPIPASPKVPSWAAHEAPFGSLNHSMAGVENEAFAARAKAEEPGLRERILSSIAPSWGNSAPAEAPDAGPPRSSNPSFANAPMPSAAGVTIPYSSVDDAAQQLSAPRAPGDSVPIGYYLASAIFLVIAVVGFGLWLAFAVI